MTNAFIRFAFGMLLIVVAAIACRQGDPSLEPKTPPSSPIPTQLDRPDDPPASPTKLPKISSQSDGG